MSIYLDLACVPLVDQMSGYGVSHAHFVDVAFATSTPGFAAAWGYSIGALSVELMLMLKVPCVFFNLKINLVWRELI